MNDRDRLRDLLLIPVAVVILLAWLASLGVAILQAEYTPLTITSPIMLMLAGFVFGVSVVGGGKSDARKD